VWQKVKKLSSQYIFEFDCLPTEKVESTKPGLSCSRSTNELLKKKKKKKKIDLFNKNATEKTVSINRL
jgi:hypothetical protein